MPRKPHIEIAGYYYIINRGIEQRVVFKEADDYEYFEELMCFYMKSFAITLYNYCLMGNHYHLLIKIQNENLSKFMRQLNMNYAIYFNKKYKRTGHLWQGRFKSLYVTDEAYLYTLMCYIEQNPLKANMVKDLKEYPYSSYRYFLEDVVPECLEATNIDKKPEEETLRDLFETISDKQERNKTIAQAYKDGYSQHMIAKVLGLNQAMGSCHYYYGTNL